MKIKVLTIKDLTKYLAKSIIIFIIMIVFANFFYGRNNPNAYFLFDSMKFASTLKKEIVSLAALNSNDEKTILTNNYLNGNSYLEQTINSELGLFKLVATTNFSDVKIGKKTDNLENTDIKNQSNNSSDGTNSTENNNQNTNTDSGEIQLAQSGLTTEILPTNIPDKATCEIFGVKLRNESDYNLSSEITDLNVTCNKNDIIIFHTHTCESYTPTEQNTYNSTGNFRTTDLNYSVARVGDELEKYLKNYGFNVVHDKSYHDYPAYNGSYNRSLITVKNLLNQYTNTDVVIDLHRDAIGDNTYAPKVKIGDDYCARIMFVIGTDGGGLKHDNWRNNVKFAIKIVQKANELYPGLCKPIIVRNSRYNHHLANNACIIEVGATGNTLEECINSMKYLSRIYNETEF